MITFVLKFTHSGYLTGKLAEFLDLWETAENVTVEKDRSSYGAWRVHFQTDAEAMQAYRMVRPLSNILSMSLVKEEVLILE